MRSLACVLLVVIPGACSSSEVTADRDAAGAVEVPIEATSPARCTVSEPTWIAGTEPLEGAWLLRGPTGPRLIGRLRWEGLHVWWTDGASVAHLPATVGTGERVLAWTGARYLHAEPGRLEALAPDFTNPTPVLGDAPSAASHVGLVEMGDRAALYYTRQGPARTRGRTQEVPWIQVLRGDGAPLGPARQLLHGRASVDVLTLRARWDFGRLVVEAEVTGAPRERSWVLDPSGQELGHFVSGRVACPRSGCVRVSAAEDRSASGSTSALALLRVDPLVHRSGFTTQVPSVGVRDVAVSGDHILVLHAPDSYSTSCKLTVIDVARRGVAADLQDGLAGCAAGRLLATPRGFVVAEHDPSRGAFTRVVRCED